MTCPRIETYLLGELRFKHPDEAFVITVPGSDGKELAPGTLNVILKKAGLK